MRKITKRSKKRSKFGQEEIAGFAIILVIVAIILLAFLASSLKKAEKNPVENYEAHNFLQAVLQQTTKCQVNENYVDVQDLVFMCEEGGICQNSNQDACYVLNDTLSRVFKAEGVWPIEEGSLYSGYALDILILPEEQRIIDRIKGGFTAENSYNSRQDFSKAGQDMSFVFTIYYEK